MKKIIMLFLFVLLTVGCGSSNINKISYDELNKKMDNKDSFILYFEGEDDDTLENTFEEVLEEYSLEAYQVNLEKVSEEDLQKFKLEIDYEEPSIVFVINGKDPSKLSHITNIYTRKDDIVKQLIDMEFIQKSE